MGCSGYLLNYRDQEEYVVYDKENYSSLAILNPEKYQKNVSYWILADSSGRKNVEMELTEKLDIIGFYDFFTKETYEYCKR